VAAGALLAACVVVAVLDGDSLTARCERDGVREVVPVRIAQIDAPERGQPFSQRSRQALIALCRDQPARLHAHGEDRYGRTLADVECRGTDAGTAQVREGLAWVFTRHATDVRLAPLEQQAREARRGLWREPAPQPPWEWRAERRRTDR
jgi:endonuclease YncB( thermonuclease family)